jgi:hypothetical protein
MVPAKSMKDGASTLKMMGTRIGRKSNVTVISAAQQVDDSLQTDKSE